MPVYLRIYRICKWTILAWCLSDKCAKLWGIIFSWAVIHGLLERHLSWAITLLIFRTKNWPFPESKWHLFRSAAWLHLVLAHCWKYPLDKRVTQYGDKSRPRKKGNLLNAFHVGGLKFSPWKLISSSETPTQGVFANQASQETVGKVMQFFFSTTFNVPSSLALNPLQCPQHRSRYFVQGK